LSLEGLERRNDYSIREKLKGFPKLTFLTIGGQREKILVDKCEELGIEVEAYKVPKLDVEQPFPSLIEGDVLNYLPTGNNKYKRTLDVLCGHIEMLSKWVETSSEGDDWRIFAEDDLSLELVDKWDFIWEDFIKSLPEDCGAVQLMNIRYDSFTIEFSKWDIWDWSAGAYLINKDYAKRLLEEYKKGENHYNFVVPPPYHNSIPETFLYREDWGMTYKLSCMVENLEEDVLGGAINGGERKHHKTSRDTIVKMWESKYSDFDIKGNL